VSSATLLCVSLVRCFYIAITEVSNARRDLRQHPPVCRIQSFLADSVVQREVVAVLIGMQMQ